MEQKIFFPGEIIVSVSERSPICTGYYPYYIPRLTKFKRELQQKKVEKKRQDITEESMRLIREDLAKRVAASMEQSALTGTEHNFDQNYVETMIESDSDDDMGLKHAREMLTAY